MPVWHTHNIKNIGSEPLITLFWINEFYDDELIQILSMKKFKFIIMKKIKSCNCSWN